LYGFDGYYWRQVQEDGTVGEQKFEAQPGSELYGMKPEGPVEQNAEQAPEAPAPEQVQQPEAAVPAPEAAAPVQA